MERSNRHLPGALCLLVLCACSAPGVSSAGAGRGGGAGPAGGAAGAGGGGGPSGAAGNQGSSGGGGAAGGTADAGFGFNPRDSGGGGAGPAPVPGENACGFQKHRLDRVPPELLLVLDRSGSMLTPAEVGTSMSTRWDETTAAVTDVVRQTDGTIHWGLKTFPTPEQCLVQPGVEVPIGPTTAPVAAAIAATQPNMGGSGTPTALAVQIATSYLRGRATINPKYLVLATDGIPACPLFADQKVIDQMVLDAITAARNAGIATFVIGIATAATDADRVLSEMARAGGRPRPGNPAYYPVASKQSLVDALGQIARVVATCDFPLTSTPPSPNDVAVNVDGNRVLRDPTRTNGWEYSADGKVVVLYGAACELVKSGQARDVDIIFGCPNVPIP